MWVRRAMGDGAHFADTTLAKGSLYGKKHEYSTKFSYFQRFIQILLGICFSQAKKLPAHSSRLGRLVPEFLIERVERPEIAGDHVPDFHPVIRSLIINILLNYSITLDQAFKRTAAAVRRAGGGQINAAHPCLR